MQPKRILIFDFVEIPERNMQSLPGVSLHIVFHPHRSDIPSIAMIIRS